MPLEFQPYDPLTGKFQRAKKQEPTQRLRRPEQLNRSSEFSPVYSATAADTIVDSTDGDHAISVHQAQYSQSVDENIARSHTGATHIIYNLTFTNSVHQTKLISSQSRLPYRFAIMKAAFHID
jgi:hypothetical protein